MLGDQEVVPVSESVSAYQILELLIGFQTANKNHLKSRVVADRVTMYVFTDRNQSSYITSEHCFLHHRVGIKSESGSKSRSNNMI